MESTVITASDLSKSKGWQFSLFSSEAKNLDRVLKGSSFDAVPLRDIVLARSRGFPQMGTAQLKKEDGIPLLSVQSITPQGVDIEAVGKFISVEEHAKLSNTQVFPGDVLVSSFIRSEGAVASVYGSKEPANLTSSLIRLKVDQRRVLPGYLVAFFNSSIGVALLRRYAIGSVQPTLNLAILLDLPIPLPPIDLQQEIIDAIDEKLQEATLLEKTAENLRLEASSLIERLLSLEE
jgi:restriction endonuclease S subunit